MVSYNLILKYMKKIFNYHKDKLCSIKRYHRLFIGVYDNFEQMLEVQNQQSNHNKVFYLVTTCQFLAPMWMPTGGLLQSMLNWFHPLDWAKIARYEANHHVMELAKIVCMLGNRYKSDWLLISDVKLFLWDVFHIAFSQAIVH